MHLTGYLCTFSQAGSSFRNTGRSKQPGQGARAGGGMLERKSAGVMPKHDGDSGWCAPAPTKRIMAIMCVRTRALELVSTQGR